MGAHGRIPLVAGPTAVGKTAVSVRVAEKIGAEIVSADSRQVYREFGVAVDKPSASDRERIPHHMVDIRSVHDPMSAGVFAREAETCVADIVGRGGRPMVVGGSTLYLEALVHGLADIPPVDPDVRLDTRLRLDQVGPEALFRELETVDPVFAATLDASKTQRVLRGLEVYRSTGRPLSSFFGTDHGTRYSYDLVILTRPRAELYARIDQRVSRMIAGGLVDEARRLATDGVDLEANPTRTIGYAEAAALLRGETDESGFVDAVRRNSRRYAKRQLTWFRRFEGATWIDLSVSDSEHVVELLASRFSTG